ncbi:glycosyltransferase family 4 protein [Pseudoxanthomonas sp. LH2527]|uniref:glycosyltransferase family 4 protein n=1 Tax=Pseudoxanthomonas sp. LH2527 TaxID=2923249 RepID=UPI001F13FC09|nr:glycosyltransferase family 4 protein [Pseudoxanthomonas sp. LH2527]MCH6482982.1 glycosyltransferase family 4 protein [Pseudoxanthomonas sp. LH2527]
MGDPLRILVLANLPPWVMGGAEHQTARLVEHWCRQGAHVEVAGFRIPDGNARLGQASVRTHRLGTVTGLGRGIRGMTYLASLAQFAWRNRARFDVAYCRGLADAALGLSLAKSIRLVRWPLMAVPINARGQGDANFLQSVPGWPLWRRLLDGQVDAINLINADIAEELDAMELCRPQRSHIPNGIDVRPAIMRTAIHHPRRLIWTGRFEYQKGLDVLIDALGRIGPLLDRCVIDLYGDGPLRQSLAERVEAEGMENVVHFAGLLGKDDVRAKLETADAFLLPSRYEGMSNAALEAMEAGLPVLCTSCGGIDLAVQDDAGWVCPAGDAARLAEALETMLSATDEQWLARGRQARSIVEQRFRIEDVAALNLEWLKMLAESKA